MREFFKYTSLNVLGMLAISCYILADTFFVAQGLGSNGLAALNLAIPVYSFVFGTGLMIGMGGATRYTMFTASKSKKKDVVYTHSLLVGIVFSILFMVVGILFSVPLTTLLGANDVVFEMTNTYLKMVLLFAPAFILNQIVICFIRNDGNPKLSMIAMVIGSLSNVVLDYLFIFPLQMGIFGAVLATCLAPIISLCVMASYFIKKSNKFHISRCEYSFNLIQSILSSGFPSFVTEISSGLVIIVFNQLILNIEGNIGVAAYGVIANLSLVVIAIFNGIAQGMQPLLTMNYGTNSFTNIKKLMNYGICTVLCLSILIYGFIFFNAELITSVFNSEQNKLLQDLANSGLKIYFLACPFVSLNLIVSIYFTSVNQALKAHVVSLLRGIVLVIPLAFIFSYLGQMKGIWSVFPVTEFIVCLIGCTLWKKTSCN